MEILLKRSYELLCKFDVYFRNIEVINYFYLEKVYNSFADMASYTALLKHKIIKRLHLTVQKGAG